MQYCLQLDRVADETAATKKELLWHFNHAKLKKGVGYQATHIPTQITTKMFIQVPTEVST